MAELTITNNREIKPYKVAVKQYEAGTTSLVFTREGYMYDQVDLRRYTAYAVTSINGSTDMTELTYDIVDGNMVITWVIGEQTLRQAGTITYQIVFKEKPAEGLPLDGSGTGVFNTYQAILQNSESIDADNAISADYPTILKQHLDLINALAGSFDSAVFYMQPDDIIPLEQRLEKRLYYVLAPTGGYFENHLGQRLTITQAQLDLKQDKRLGERGQMVVITDVNGDIKENTVVTAAELYSLEGFELSKGTFQTQLDNKVETSDFETHIQANNAAIDTLNDTLEAVQIASDIIEQSMVQHAQNETVHVTAADREKWNSPQLPVGTLITSIRSSIDGWLRCNGGTYMTSAYPELAAVLGATGSNSFAVPNFSGRTMVGASASHPVGSVIDAGLPEIAGTYGPIQQSSEAVTNTNVTGAFVDSSSTAGGTYGGGGNDPKFTTLDFKASKSNAIYGNSDTVQPPAIAVNVFIKY